MCYALIILLIISISLYIKIHCKKFNKQYISNKEFTYLQNVSKCAVLYARIEYDENNFINEYDLALEYMYKAVLASNIDYHSTVTLIRGLLIIEFYKLNKDQDLT